MSAIAADPALALQLPADTYFELVHTLRLTLPPPLGDSAADLVRRDRAAIARIAALAPANPAEADLAGQFVAASDQWKACLRLVQLPATAPAMAIRCRAQALSMMREANSALRLLLRMQDARRRIEADGAGCDRLAWTEHCALRQMAEALSTQPGPPETACPAETARPVPDTSSDEVFREEPTPPAAPASGGVSRAAADDGAGEASARLAPGVIPREANLEAAERYAATYPERAAAIRRTGRPPSDVRYFDPPEITLFRTLVDAQTPALLALDRAFQQAPKA